MIDDAITVHVGRQRALRVRAGRTVDWRHVVAGVVGTEIVQVPERVDIVARPGLVEIAVARISDSVRDVRLYRRALVPDRLYWSRISPRVSFHPRTLRSR